MENRIEGIVGVVESFIFRVQSVASRAHSPGGDQHPGKIMFVCGVGH